MTPQLSPDQPHTILIATNAAYDMATLGQMLGRHGLRVHAAQRGDEALAAAAGGDIALALLDVALAGSASLELCRRIIELCGGALPVFLLSSAPDDDERGRAALAGAADYLPLPFHADDMAERILLTLGVLAPAP